MDDVTVQFPDEDLALVDRLAAERECGREEAIREAVRRGMREELTRVALDRYRDGELGMRGAANVAGTTIVDLLGEANDRDVLKNDDETRLSGDVEALR